MLINEGHRKKGSLYNIEIGLIVMGLLFIGTVICLLYTIYAYMKRNDKEDSETVHEMEVEEVKTANSNEIEGVTYDNPLFTRGNWNDDPFKDDFEENDNNEKVNYFLGKDLEEASDGKTN